MKRNKIAAQSTRLSLCSLYILKATFLMHAVIARKQQKQTKILNDRCYIFNGTDTMALIEQNC